MNQSPDQTDLLEFLIRDHAPTYIDMMCEIWEKNRHLELTVDEWKAFLKYIKKLRAAGQTLPERVEIYEEMIELFLGDPYK